MSVEAQIRSTIASSHWEKIGVGHHHGIVIPLFSLRTQESLGVGQYLDLIPLIRFCKSVGFRIIQLLPLNDSHEGRSPYSALSAFALHPLFLTLTHLPLIEKMENYRERLKPLSELNKETAVAYQKVYPLKMAFLEEYFETLFDEISAFPHYKSFVAENQEWLHSYALFRALKETQEMRSWEKWPNPLKSPSDASRSQLEERYKGRMSFYMLLQFLCYEQMQEVKRFAESQGVLIEGDIPILVNRDSADVWAERPFFLLNLSTGAPPDSYSTMGQNWGFPAYDWTNMERANYSYFRKRLEFAQKLYHLYRLDHIVGLFRLWTIPQGHKAAEGSFLPRNQEEWIPQGKKILEFLLNSCPLLPIGEDLGVIPSAVRLLLKTLGIPGTKMMRWERRWEGDGSFIPPSEYNPISMTTVTTHDSDTLQLWWRHAPAEAKLLCKEKGWDYKPFLSPEYHETILFDSHHSASLLHINPLQEYLALFPSLISPNPLNERINIPGRVLAKNWTYRLLPTLEHLETHDALKEKIRTILR